MTAPADLVAALSLLRPHDVALPKRRVGSAADGGYILLDLGAPETAVLSYGVDINFDFEAQMAAEGARVVMFDHTVEPPPALPDRVTFVQEGVGPNTDPAQNLGRLEDHWAAHFSDAFNGCVLKMDIEGAEYSVFNSLDDATLGRFSQIAVELHHMNRLGDPTFCALFTSAMKKLSRDFFIFHVHANNSDGPMPSFVNGLPVSATLEVSLVNRQRAAPQPLRTWFPTELDTPCVDKRDRMLWFFPFCPGEPDVAQCKRDFVRVVDAHPTFEKFKWIQVPKKPAQRIAEYFGKLKK